MDKEQARLRIKNFDIIAKNRKGPFHVVLKSTGPSNLYLKSFPSGRTELWEKAFWYEYDKTTLNNRIDTLAINNLKLVLITSAGDIDIQPGDVNE
jgi:hypothetical protein